MPPKKALQRLCEVLNLADKNPVVFILERENIDVYKEVLTDALDELERRQTIEDVRMTLRESPLETSKKLKALEIIKSKKVNVMLFITIKHMGVKRYNECFDAEEHQLTQQEYDLLKEVLL